MVNLILKTQLCSNFHLRLQIRKLFRKQPFLSRKTESRNYERLTAIVRPLFWSVQNWPVLRYIGFLIALESRCSLGT
jgi:hypothetical protein